MAHFAGDLDTAVASSLPHPRLDELISLRQLTRLQNIKGKNLDYTRDVRCISFFPVLLLFRTARGSIAAELMNGPRNRWDLRVLRTTVI